MWRHRISSGDSGPPRWTVMAGSPSRRSSSVRSASAHGRRVTSKTPPDESLVQPSVVVEPLLDELLLDGSTIRVEAGVLEVLLIFEVHIVLAAAVLLDRDHDPVAEALRLVRVELDVDLGDDVV